jgi:very-short-patch-repair endonuclease
VSALKRLKEVHVSEYVDEPTQLTVDIYIPDRNLVIEVQGPSHYITDLKTGQTHLRQEDEFKLSVLKKRGYNVELISIHDFGRKNATRNADNMIGDIVNRWPLVSR